MYPLADSPLIDVVKINPSLGLTVKLWFIHLLISQRAQFALFRRCNKTLLSPVCLCVYVRMCVYTACVYLLFLAVHTNYFKLNCRLFFVRTYWLLITSTPPVYCSTVYQRTNAHAAHITDEDKLIGSTSVVKQATKAPFLEILTLQSFEIQFQPAIPALKFDSSPELRFHKNLNSGLLNPDHFDLPIKSI